MVKRERSEDERRTVSNEALGRSEGVVEAGLVDSGNERGCVNAPPQTVGRWFGVIRKVWFNTSPQTCLPQICAYAARRFITARVSKCLAVQLQRPCHPAFL
jgi:hypothetical protein